jgi:hypothetical protein
VPEVNDFYLPIGLRPLSAREPYWLAKSNGFTKLVLQTPQQTVALTAKKKPENSPKDNTQ